MPNERCTFKHKDALGKETVHSGEIVERVNDAVVRIKPDAFGFMLLIPVADLESRDGERAPDA